MASRKPAPERSRIARTRPPVAYARRQKGEGGEGREGKDGTADDAEDEAKAGAPSKPGPKPATTAPIVPGPADEPDTKTGIVTPDQIKKQIENIPLVKKAEATTVIPPDLIAELLQQPEAKPLESSRARSETMIAGTPVGQPPEMPTEKPPVGPVSMSGVENPTHMPGPRDIPDGHPTDPASAPGHVPPGDSRSLRRGAEFALVYRLGTFVVSRFGVLGTRGQWRVVEYPTSGSASHSYAKECSRYMSDGFSDYRA